MKKFLFFTTTAITLGTATFSNAQTLPSYLPTDGLVGWWPFNGNANDESGNGNHGTVNGATISNDRFGTSNNSFNFSNSANNYLEFGNIHILDLTTSFSTSAWFNYSLTPTSPNDFFTILSDGSYSDPNGFGLIFNPNTILFRNNSSFGVVAQTTLNLNTWYNIVTVYSSDSVKVFLNSILIGQNAHQNSNSFNTNYSFKVGKCDDLPIDPNDHEYYFNGLIDDIAIYNRALTQEEITALYTATPTNGGGGNNNTASTNVPQGISYQAVARNAQGLPLINTALQVKFTLLADSLTGAAEYAELHSLTTNDLGLFTTAFGTGTPLSGTFANINWAGGNKFVKIEADEGSGFIEMGTQQMLTVPYSMRSQTSSAIQNNALPVYANNAEAQAGGLVAGQMYRTGAGVLMVVY